MQQRNRDVFHEDGSRAVPGVGDDDDEIGAGALEALGLASEVRAALVPEGVVDVVRALGKVHGIDNDFASVQAAELLPHRGVDELIILGSGEISATSDDADSLHFGVYILLLYFGKALGHGAGENAQLLKGHNSQRMTLHALSVN